MSYLSIKDPISNHLVLPDEGASVLTEVVKDLYDATIFKHLLESQLERVHLQEIEYEALLSLRKSRAADLDSNLKRRLSKSELSST